jgi:hypothetical protein
MFANRSAELCSRWIRTLVWLGFTSTFVLGAGKGFVGQLSHRVWMLKVHTSVEPFAVILRNSTDTIVIPKASSVPTVECARRFQALRSICFG